MIRSGMMEKLTKEQIDARLAKLRESRLDDETYTVVRSAMAMCYSIEPPWKVSEIRQCNICGKDFEASWIRGESLSPKTAEDIATQFRFAGMDAQFYAIVLNVYKNTAQRLMKCTSRQKMNKSGMLVCPTLCTEVKMTDIRVHLNMNWCSDF